MKRRFGCRRLQADQRWPPRPRCVPTTLLLTPTAAHNAPTQSCWTHALCAVLFPPFAEKLTSLRHLYVDVSTVTDGALVHLRPLHQLETLGMFETQITDAGIDHLVCVIR